MARIIIDVRYGVDAATATALVAKVLQEGKISIASDVPHYCWATRFKVGSDDVMVYTRRKKPYQKSDSFIVYKDER